MASKLKHNQFHPFPRLPREIQRKVIEACLIPRLVYMTFPKHRPSFKRYEDSVALAWLSEVDVATRELVMDNYRDIFDDSKCYPTGTQFNLRLDTLCLNDPDSGSLDCLRELVFRYPHDMVRIHRIQLRADARTDAVLRKSSRRDFRGLLRNTKITVLHGLEDRWGKCNDMNQHWAVIKTLQHLRASLLQYTGEGEDYLGPKVECILPPQWDDMTEVFPEDDTIKHYSWKDYMMVRLSKNLKTVSYGHLVFKDIPGRVDDSFSVRWIDKDVPWENFNVNELWRRPDLSHFPSVSDLWGRIWREREYMIPAERELREGRLRGAMLKRGLALTYFNPPFLEDGWGEGHIDALLAAEREDIVEEEAKLRKQLRKRRGTGLTDVASDDSQFFEDPKTSGPDAIAKLLAEVSTRAEEKKAEKARQIAAGTYVPSHSGSSKSARSDELDNTAEPDEGSTFDVDKSYMDTVNPGDPDETLITNQGSDQEGFADDVEEVDDIDQKSESGVCAQPKTPSPP